MNSVLDFAKYNLNSPRQAAYFLEKRESNFKWRENEEILEVGCADGLISRTVLFPFFEKNVKNLKKLVCGDVFPLAIEIAKSTNQNPKIEFVEMDFGDVRVGEKYSGSFDKIFAFYCFMLVHPQESWPKNVFNMLKPEGQIFSTIVRSPNFITDIMDDQLVDTKAPWFSYIQNRHYPLVFYGDKPVETISKMITDVGLVINDIQMENIRSTFESREFFEETVKSFCHFAKHVPEELRNDYLKDYVNGILKRCKKDEKGFDYYEFDVINFVATKA